MWNGRELLAERVERRDRARRTGSAIPVPHMTAPPDRRGPRRRPRRATSASAGRTRARSRASASRTTGREGPRSVDGTRTDCDAPAFASHLVTRAAFVRSLMPSRRRARTVRVVWPSCSRSSPRPRAWLPRAARRASLRLCADCTRALPWLPARVCARCGLPGHGGAAARPRAAAFARAWSPLAYDGVARELVAALKFRAALPVAGLMAAHVAANLPGDLRAPRVLVPVPAQRGAAPAARVRSRRASCAARWRRGSSCRSARASCGATARRRQVGASRAVRRRHGRLAIELAAAAAAPRCSSTTSTRPARRSTPAPARSAPAAARRWSRSPTRGRCEARPVASRPPRPLAAGPSPRSRFCTVNRDEPAARLLQPGADVRRDARRQPVRARPAARGARRRAGTPARRHRRRHRQLRARVARRGLGAGRDRPRAGDARPGRGEGAGGRRGRCPAAAAGGRERGRRDARVDAPPRRGPGGGGGRGPAHPAAGRPARADGLHARGRGGELAVGLLPEHAGVDVRVAPDARRAARARARARATSRSASATSRTARSPRSPRSRRRSSTPPGTGRRASSSGSRAITPTSSPPGWSGSARSWLPARPRARRASPACSLGRKPRSTNVNCGWVGRLGFGRAV